MVKRQRWAGTAAKVLELQAAPRLRTGPRQRNKERSPARANVQMRKGDGRATSVGRKKTRCLRRASPSASTSNRYPDSKHHGRRGAPQKAPRLSSVRMRVNTPLSRWRGRSGNRVRFPAFAVGRGEGPSPKSRPPGWAPAKCLSAPGLAREIAMRFLVLTNSLPPPAHHDRKRLLLRRPARRRRRPRRAAGR